MSEKCFSENDCNTSSAFDSDPRFGCSNRGLPISDFTVRSMTEVRRNPQAEQLSAISNMDRSSALQQQFGCDSQECSTPDIDIQNFNDREFHSGYTRNNKTRDGANGEFWKLQMSTPSHTVHNRDGVADLMRRENQRHGNTEQKYNPENYLRKNMPLFTDPNEDSQTMFGTGDPAFMYKLGAGREFQSFVPRLSGYSQDIQPLSNPGFGQSTRMSDPTKKFCRSDFASKLPPLE